MICYWDYQELLENALHDPTPDNLNALGVWYEKYGETYRGGDEFAIDDDNRLCRIWDADHENIVGYELR